MRDPRNLILFTTAFPYGHGEQFLETELPYLTARFRRVLVVPTQTPGVMRPLPFGAEVDTSLAAARPTGWRIVAESTLDAARSRHFYRELARHHPALRHWRALERATRYWGDARRTAQWLRTCLARRGWEAQEALLYTYWLGRQTLGCGMAKAARPGLTLVTRAHGSDLYPTAHHPAYLPFREATLQGVDRLFTVSAHGRRYVAEAHPEAALRVEIARLGVTDPGFLAPPSRDGVLRLVSCSAMERLKRLDKLIEALAALADRWPGLPIHWDHLGDGPQRPALETQAMAMLGGRMRWTFHGRLPNAQVRAYYRDHAVDVFVNVSDSEGVPVSIMEAMAAGVPVVAPAIGGIPELVTAANGVILPAGPEVGAIADALAHFAPGRADPARRATAHQSWRALAQAERTYAAFADRLAELGAIDRQAAS
jgi:glycosyltransferase involved in cell wall biosynthesis